MAVKGRLSSGDDNGPLRGTDVCCTVESFLSMYSFDSLTGPSAKGFGPVACAAIEGNFGMIKLLVDAKCDPNTRVTESDDIVTIGWTPILRHSSTMGE
jgi:ankyrin repeat protein